MSECDFLKNGICDRLLGVIVTLDFVVVIDYRVIVTSRRYSCNGYIYYTEFDVVLLRWRERFE